MNLIKLNPLKKLMLVILSWFVYAVYHVEVHAWHIGQSTDVFNDTGSFTIANNNDSDPYFQYCRRGGLLDPSKYYIFPGNTSFVGFYIYYSGGNEIKYSSVSGTLCLTEDEFEDMQTFFGNVDSDGKPNRRWGNFMAIDCCDGKRISSVVAATCNDVLKGHMFPVLLATDSTMKKGSGFSTEYSRAYTAAKIQIPGSGDKYTQGCTLEPGRYVASTNVSGGIESAFKKCPAGYYCPGVVSDNQGNSQEISIGVGMSKLTLYAGLFECPAGHYCPSKASSPTICDIRYYANPGASSCTHCPSTSQYDPEGKSIVNPSLIGTWSNIGATTSTAGAKSATECYVEPEPPYLLAGEGGVFAYTGACYYS